MKNTVNQLLEHNQALQNELSLLREAKAKLESELQNLHLQLDYLLEQFKLSHQRQFDSSSEKHLTKIDTFDEPQAQLSPEAQEDVAEETETITYERRKNTGKAKRTALPDYLPREDRIFDIPESEKTCACCGDAKVCFGKDVSEQLKVMPPKVVVISYQRLKYSCKSCEGEITVAPKPDLFLPKSIADASLVAYTIVMKYVDHIPLYRQEKIWARNKVELPRNTTCAWVMKAAELCLPLWQMIRQEIVASQYVQVDETTVQVMKEPQRKNTQKSYMWVYRKASGAPLVFYDYQETRQAKHPKTILSGFKGTVQTDAYSGYDWLDEINDVKHLACMAHARRPFAELQKLSKHKKGLAYDMLEMIAVLYKIESDIKNLSDEKKYEERQEKSKPVLEKIHAWLAEKIHSAPPKSKIGRAIGYMQTHWEKLIRYIDDGAWDIDNNRIENSIRPFALGRKNWLFAGNPRGARAGAILYSLIMSAKENGLNEHAYLTFVFNRIRSCKNDSDYQKLIPGYLTIEEQAELALK